MTDRENRSIEETVEELRRQIQEITEDAKKVKKVYLTFDDGPSVYTREILDILKGIT